MRRIQRSRRKGWRMPHGAVYVGRPTKWCNPYTLALVGDVIQAYDCGKRVDPRERAVEAYRDALLSGLLDVTVAEVRRELKGKTLACWCRTDERCHADVLLEIANGEP